MKEEKMKKKEREAEKEKYKMREGVEGKRAERREREVGERDRSVE